MNHAEPQDDRPENDDVTGAEDSDHLSLEEQESADAGNDTAQEEIATLREELAHMKDQTLRALAEADNVRKRAVKEREDAGKYAVSAFAKSLLDFADNFRRALQSIPEGLEEEEPRIKAVIEGIVAMDKEMLSTFEKHGITRIEPLDEMFDPNFHEVMFETPVPDKPKGMIVELIEAGYMLNGRLLRPARVGLSKGGEDVPKVDTEA